MRKSDRKLLQAAYNVITDITFTSSFRALKEEIRARLAEPELKTGLDQLIEQIRYLECQIAERKNQ